MKHLIALVLISLPFTAGAATNEIGYDLKVDGMVCAFCAYNVSKQIETLDGVVPESVDVDLERGAVTLRSAELLDEDRLGDLLLQAGFTLAGVTKKSATTSHVLTVSDGPTFLTITMMADELEAGELDTMLEELGAIAAQRSGRITVVAPEELEVAILGPVLGGRKTVLKVDYEPAAESDRPIIVSVAAQD